MKLNLLFIFALLLFSLKGLGYPHPTFLVTDVNDRVLENATVTLISVDYDTTRYAFKEGDHKYMVTKGDVYGKTKIIVRCSGYKSIRINAYLSKSQYYFKMGETGTKYLIKDRTVYPYKPLPNLALVSFKEDRENEFVALLKQLNVPVPHNYKKVPRQARIGTKENEGIWGIQHSYPFQLFNSSTLKGLRATDSLVYGAYACIKLYDKKTQYWRTFGIQRRLYVQSVDNKDEVRKFLTEKGLQLDPKNYSGIDHWITPPEMGTGIIDILSELNEKFYCSYNLYSTNYWDLPDSGRPPID